MCLMNSHVITPFALILIFIFTVENFIFKSFMDKFRNAQFLLFTFRKSNTKKQKV